MGKGEKGKLRRHGVKGGGAERKGDEGRGGIVRWGVGVEVEVEVEVEI